MRTAIVDARAAEAGARVLRAALLGTAGAVLLGLAPPLAARAAAVNGGPVIVIVDDKNDDRDDAWDDDWEDAWEDYNRTLLQMQRESISSQEEQAREAGRSARRDELEKSREKSAQEREAYFQAILEASQASLRSPRGVYFRKPGYSSAEPPGPAAAVVEVGGVPYLYDQGIFWLHQGTDYLVVTAPAGAIVGTLPRGAARIPFRGETYWYFFGTFFAGSDGRYAVVRPPGGLTVFYLPDGYAREQAGGADVYRFGETLFKPVFVQGVLAYQVVADR
jgi:hypothetical protein